MERVISNKVADFVNQKIKLQGWLHNFRDIGKIAFLILRDRGGVIQTVVENKDLINKLSVLQIGAVLTVYGEVKENKGKFEIINPEIDVDVEIKKAAPVDISKETINADIDTLLDHRPVVLRHQKYAAIFKVQAKILEVFANTMRELGFTEFRNPLLIGSPSESGASVFEVNYFDGNAYLAQSPQIYKQIMVGVFERAFTVSTVFRAEKHNTSRHIMELTQMDGEMGFIESYDEVLDVVETVVRRIITTIDSDFKNELQMWGATVPKLPEGNFPRLKVKEALKIIEERTGRSAQREELDLDPEDEREICRYILEKYNSDFMWLLNFKKDKNFYTWNNPEDADESLSFDLECRGLEWLSGTHRIHKYDKLKERLLNQGLKEEHYEHYLQAFEFGMPSEAGFSFGLERLTQQIFGFSNIREATLFPTDLKRIAGAKRHQEIIHGGKNISEAIKGLLKSRGVNFEFLEHEDSPTSEGSAALKGIELSNIVKSIMLRGKKTGLNYLVAISGDRKVNMKSVAEFVGEPVEMEKPEVVLERYGVRVGGVPPFGKFMGMKVLVDEGVNRAKNVTFSAGESTISVTMGKDNFLECLDGEVGVWGKE